MATVLYGEFQVESEVESEVESNVESEVESEVESKVEATAESMALGGPEAGGPTPKIFRKKKIAGRRPANFFRVRHYRTGATIEQVRRSKRNFRKLFLGIWLNVTLSISRKIRSLSVPT